MLGSFFLGGNGSDYGYGVAFDPQENVIVVGSTYSANFPSTINAYGGEADGFISYLVKPRCVPGFPLEAVGIALIMAIGITLVRKRKSRTNSKPPLQS